MHLKAFYHLQKALERVGEQDFDMVHTYLSSAADLYIFPQALRIYVEQHYSAQVMAENYVKIYEKVIRTNGDRAATRGRILIGEAAT